MMSYLLIALVALALGPLVLRFLQQRPALAAALDGFVAVSIVALILLHFVPEVLEQRSVAVLVALVVGFFLPLVQERVTRDTEGRADRLGLFLGLTGLAIHAGLDGAALATVEGVESSTALALAVILHRLPVGIAVWWLVPRVVGRRGAVVALGGLMVATVIGFYSGGAAMRIFGDSQIVLLYQAIVGGSLVHVVVHRGYGFPIGDHSHPHE